MSVKIGIRAWIDFAFRKIFGKPDNDICRSRGERPGAMGLLD